MLQKPWYVALYAAILSGILPLGCRPNSEDPTKPLTPAKVVTEFVNDLDEKNLARAATRVEGATYSKDSEPLERLLKDAEFAISAGMPSSATETGADATVIIHVDVKVTRPEVSDKGSDCSVKLHRDGTHNWRIVPVSTQQVADTSQTIYPINDFAWALSHPADYNKAAQVARQKSTP